MPRELTKSQKKAAHALLDLALDRECAAFISKVSRLVDKPLSDDDKPNHTRYLELYKAINGFDKHLGKTYDSLSGNMLLSKVTSLLMEGVLNLKDLDICDDQLRGDILGLLNLYMEMNK